MQGWFGLSVAGKTGFSGRLVAISISVISTCSAQLQCEAACCNMEHKYCIFGKRWERTPILFGPFIQFYHRRGSWSGHYSNSKFWLNFAYYHWNHFMEDNVWRSVRTGARTDKFIFGRHRRFRWINHFVLRIRSFKCIFRVDLSMGWSGRKAYWFRFFLWLLIFIPLRFYWLLYQRFNFPT